MNQEAAAALANGAEQHYWAALAEGRLEVQHCAACGRTHWPAVWRCGACGSWDHTWSEVPPAGSVYTWTRTWHAFGGNEHLPRPFVTLLVELADGGPRYLGLFEGEDAGLHIGATVIGRVTATEVAGTRIPQIIWHLVPA